jgi:hypothetical protein
MPEGVLLGHLPPEVSSTGVQAGPADEPETPAPEDLNAGPGRAVAAAAPYP